MHVWTFSTFTPGAGIWEPILNSTMMNRTNNSFLRRSGVRNALT